MYLYLYCVSSLNASRTHAHPQATVHRAHHSRNFWVLLWQKSYFFGTIQSGKLGRFSAYEKWLAGTFGSILAGNQPNILKLLGKSKELSRICTEKRHNLPFLYSK